MASGHRYKRLDSLRGLAALSVGVGHAFFFVPFLHGTALRVVAVGIFNGEYAVDLFFVLSGFVLTDMVRGFSGAHYAGYLGRRLLRLYPLLWLSLILAYVVQALVSALGSPCGAFSVSTCHLITPPTSIVAVLQSAIPVDYQLDPVVWTIRIEVAMSIVYPLMLLTWMKGGAAGRIAAAASVALIFVFGHRMVAHFPLLFLAGIALHDLRISSARYANSALAIALTLMAFSGFVFRGHTQTADLVAGTSAALLIALVAYRCPRWLAVTLDNRFLLRLGELSYGYYLLNSILLWLIARAEARPLSRLLATGSEGRAFLVASLLAVCAAAATVLVAGAANRMIEKPSISLSRAVEQRILRLLTKRPLERPIRPSPQSDVP